MDEVLKFKYKKGVQEVYPAHPLVSNWIFNEDEHAEATLAHAFAVVAEKNGMRGNDIMHLYPAILRMLKSEIPWSK